MNERDTSPEDTLMLRRVRCGQCQMPLLQVYQGDLLYTLHRHGEETASQQLPTYSYRTLTDSTLLLACPQCGTILSPVTTTAVLPRTVVTQESQAVQQQIHDQ